MLSFWALVLFFPQPAVPDGFRCLAETYPGVVTEFFTGADGVPTVRLSDGSTLVWDDGQAGKSLAQKLATPDLEDTLSTPYPLERLRSPPPKDDDPGRVRSEALLKALYGHTPEAVRQGMEAVEWMPKNGGGRLFFNTRQGAAAALRRVSADLDGLPERFHRYVTKTAGTFNWRHIKGTRRLSAHAFAIAIDVNVKYTDYWRWAQKKGVDLVYRNRIPHQIVEIFERHGFIWGGKWFHFDTMHFEYRPELLHPRCVKTRP